MEVPKIIHQLWIGDKPIPINALNSVKNMNHNFEYMFWCETTIEEKLNIPARYQRQIDAHEEVWGKADLYRWIILEKYGGVFVDADMVSIQPIDDFLLSKAFFCWENEKERKNLCATSLQGYPPNHIIPQKAIKWILENNIVSKETGIPSWQLVGPGLLSRVYHTLPNKDIVNVFPHYYFLPDHHTGSKYYGHGKVYMTHEWGSTHNTYNEINTMSIPHHHTPPNNSIDIHIPKTTINKQLKDVMKSIKNMEGHFNVNIYCENDISKYIKSMRNVYWKKKETTLTEIMNEEGSDKGKGRHNFTIYYEKLFQYIKDEITTFCEIGLGTNNPYIKSSMGVNGIPCASVKGWERYFPKAQIYGGDIDTNILIKENRISCFHIDMCSKNSIEEFWKNIPNKMDIILDDGLHEFDANVLLFENSFDKFKYYYIIEDIGKIYFMKWESKLDEWRKKYPNYEFELFINPIPTNNYDNNLIIIKNIL